MGDRTWTSITFSGIISREVADELVEQLKDQGCYVDVGPEGDLSIEHLRMPHAQFYDEECNYATMDGVEACCHEHGISFLKSWGSGGGYEAGTELYNAVINQSIGLPGGDDYCLGLTELRGFLKEGKSLEEVVNYIDHVADFKKHYPPLEIQE